MTISTIFTIAIGASLGAVLRFWLGGVLNPVFPTIPLGTLSSNLLGGFLIGAVLILTKDSAFLPYLVKIGIITGFLGGLTTFSTFSAETVTLLSHQEFFWSFVLIGGHVFGSLIACFLGMYCMKLILSLVLLCKV